MQANLTWPEARSLALAGANVRRAQWADRWIFAPRGVIFWLENLAGTRRIVQAGDFQRTEFLARDWTDAGVDQNKCVGLPPLEATLTLSPTTVTEGGASTATLSIPAAISVDSVFSVTTHPRGRATHVGTVTIPAGSTSVTFSVTTVDVDLPSGVIVTAASELFGAAQAALAVTAAPPPPPAPVVLRFSRGDRTQATGAFFLQRVENPFSSAATVVMTGTVDDHLQINGAIVHYGTGGAFPAQSFVLAGGAAFTFAAVNRQFTGDNFVAYDVTIVISV